MTTGKIINWFLVIASPFSFVAIIQRFQDMSILSCLPVELVLEILAWCVYLPGQPSLKNICLVSRQFCQIVQPILLQSVILHEVADVQEEHHSEQHREQYERYLRQSNQLARTLSIDLGTAHNIRSGVRSIGIQLLHGLLRSKIGSFASVRRVNWKLSAICNEPPWIQYAVVDALSTLYLQTLVVTILEDAIIPTLGFLSDVSSLSINYSGTFQPALDALQYGLSQLISQSPNLSALELISSEKHPVDLDAIFNMVDHLLERKSALGIPLKYLGIFGGSGSLPSFSSIATRHLQHLEELSLYRTVDLRDNSSLQMWDCIRDQNIRLKKISTDAHTVEPSFFEYLQSYKGLESLRMSISFAADAGNSNRINGADHPLEPCTITPDIFLSQLVPYHSFTLSELDLMVSNIRAWMWPFSIEILDCLDHFPALAHLGITLDSDALGENAVHSLLHFADNHSILQALTIYQSAGLCETGHGTNISRFFHFKHGEDSKSYLYATNPIHEYIISYESDGCTVDCMYRIYIDDSTYVRRRKDDGGHFSFTLV